MYHHRAWHGSIVVGDYLYIDGGELTTWNGTGNGYIGINSYYESKGNILTAPDNRTYSIDLTSSWTNESVQINSIYKAAPIFNFAALWPDASRNSFFSYDGGFSGSISIVNDTMNELQQFTPNGYSGHWTQVAIPPSSNFSSLTRTSGASYGHGNGYGFALGGRESTGTDLSLNSKAVLVPGLVIFNSSANEWFNVSSEGFSYTGFASRGSLQFAPSFGSNGLLFAFGGDANEVNGYVPYDNMSIYNVATQQWGLQSTTGEAPTPSRNLCAVGVQGDEDTYEIFVYGGWEKPKDNAGFATEATLNNGAVYVLTLPAFRWFKQTSPVTFPRYGHSCSVARNQMIVSGGCPVFANHTLEEIPPDPWPNGIGVYNLTALDWSDQYDHQAANYMSPSVVKEYYRSNSRYPDWSSDEVKQWFVRRVEVSNGTSAAVAHKSNTPVAAIAGGTVGGVVGLLLILFVIWFLRRRHQKTKSTSMVVPGSNVIPGPSELPEAGRTRIEMDEGLPFEVRAKQNVSEAVDSSLYEVHSNNRPNEAASNAIYELPQTVYELPHNSTTPSNDAEKPS